VCTVIGMQLVERRSGRGRSVDACILEDQVEEEPPAARIRGGADHLPIVESPSSVRFSPGKRLRRDVDAVTGERLADTRPVRKDQHAASVEENRFEGHSSLYEVRGLRSEVRPAAPAAARA